MSRIVIMLAVGIIALSAMCSDSLVAPESRPNATTNSPPDETKSPECGDPVGVFTGSAYEVAEDLRVVCPDLDLVMFRSYSSGSMDEGPLGFGWTHTYDWRVVPDGARVVVHASGERGPSDRVHLFVQCADGPVSKRQIRAALPDISEATIENALGAMVRAGQVEKLGASRATSYRWLG